MLLQLGGPASLDEVQPFLESMFRDPDLLRVPIPRRLRNWLAARFAAHRAKHVRELYATIGGGSPIGRMTALQASMLEEAVRSRLRARVVVAMRYGGSGTAEAIEEVKNAGCSRLVLLPLYPQYSAATTGSSLREWKTCATRAEMDLPTGIVRSYATHPGYIAAVAQRLREGLGALPEDPTPRVVFSAHGLPQKYVRQGDPYQSQIERTVALVGNVCGLSEPTTLCYQSRVGPQRWLRPSLEDTIRKLAAEGAKSILVVPVSFVSDHLETLSEIDIEARQLAIASGVRYFATMPGLNASTAFIEALADLALGADPAKAGGATA